jgi:hypothetical protein
MLSCVVDHEKREFYVEFLFAITENDTPVEVPEPKTRGPYPAGVLWVPTYQVGVVSKHAVTIVDDGKWLPKKGVRVSEIDHLSFLFADGPALLVRSGGKSALPCVFCPALVHAALLECDVYSSTVALASCRVHVVMFIRARSRSRVVVCSGP